MIGAARLSLLLCVLVLAKTSVARAEFRGKGSTVGRILSESTAYAAAAGEDGANDSIEDGASAQPEDEKPISRDALNALMKHPTEPVYDPLRPMSGKWVRCQAVVTQSSQTPAKDTCAQPGCYSSTPTIQARQDRYSSTDRSHFSHTVSLTSDSECKNVVSQERSMYECTSDKSTLLCKVTKRESKTGSGAWSNVKLGDNEKPMTLTFPGQPKHSKKHAKAHDLRKLEARINGETISLDFEANPPAHGHKTND